MEMLFTYAGFGFGMAVFAALFAVALFALVMFFEVFFTNILGFSFAPTWIWVVPVLLFAAPGLYIKAIDWAELSWFDSLVIRPSSLSGEGAEAINDFQGWLENPERFAGLTLTDLREKVLQVEAALKARENAIDKRIENYETKREELLGLIEELEANTRQTEALNEIEKRQLEAIAGILRQDDGPIVTERSIKEGVFSAFIGFLVGAVLTWGGSILLRRRSE